MSPSPPASPSSPRASAHAYACNGLDILQAASDAADAIHHQEPQSSRALEDAAAAAVAASVAAAVATGGPDVDSHDLVPVPDDNSLPPPPLSHPQHLEQNSDGSHEHLQHHDHLQHHHQNHHQHQQQHLQTDNDLLSPAASVSLLRDPTINPKLTRLRRACDMCSSRKVKCDDSGIPCRPCREIGVDCTYDRETKRRGPPNKHAEAAKAAKRSRLEHSSMAVNNLIPLATATATAAVPSPSPHNAAKTLLNMNSGIGPDLDPLVTDDAAAAASLLLDAEAIAPLPLLELLVDDFFTYIYPLAPFPHEPTFRHSFANREDRSRPEFLGLLAAMICALVASFPRSASHHLKAQHSPRLFPRPIALVDRCRNIALLARGPRWALKQPKTIDDAATSYFLGLASGCVRQWNASRLFLSETLTLMRELGFGRPSHPGDLPTFGNDSFLPDPLPFNHVKDQIGKRIFWCLLLAVRSFSQLGASHADIVIAPSTPSLPYPAYPENVDDICVLANEIIHQPDGGMTLLTALRFGIDIYTTMNGVVSLELAYGMSTLPWPDQRLLLRDGLLAAKGILDSLPPDLQLGHRASEADSAAGLDESALQYVPPAWPEPQPAHDVRNVIKAQPLRRRRLQYDIQRVGIFVSHLATRCHFVDLYFSLRRTHLAEKQQHEEEGVDPGQEQTEEEKVQQATEDKEMLESMVEEGDLIAQNLLSALSSVSQLKLEPNGGWLIGKMRQVAAALLDEAPERRGPFVAKTADILAELVELLAKMEKTGLASGGGDGGGSGSSAADLGQMTADDEADEEQCWAQLREFQLRLAVQEGITESD